MNDSLIWNCDIDRLRNALLLLPPPCRIRVRTFFLPPLLLPLDGWLLGENRIVVFPVFTFYSSIVSLFFSPFKRLPQRRTHVERRRWYMATVFVFFFFFFKCVTNGPLNRRNGERWQERRFGPAVRKRAQDGRRRLYCFFVFVVALNSDWPEHYEWRGNFPTAMWDVLTGTRNEIKNETNVSSVPMSLPIGFRCACGRVCGRNEVGTRSTGS